MTRLTLPLLLWTTATAIVVGCGASVGDGEGPGEGPLAQRPEERLPVFPHRYEDPDGAEPMALMFGTLALRGECLRIDAEGASYLALWPTRTTLESVGARWMVRDTMTDVSAEVGGPIRVSGGELPTPPEPPASSAATCGGPYWEVTALLADRPAAQPPPPPPSPRQDG